MSTRGSGVMLCAWCQTGHHDQHRPLITKNYAGDTIRCACQYCEGED